MRESRKVNLFSLLLSALLKLYCSLINPKKIYNFLFSPNKKMPPWRIQDINIHKMRWTFHDAECPHLLSNLFTFLKLVSPNINENLLAFVFFSLSSFFISLPVTLLTLCMLCQSPSYLTALIHPKEVNSTTSPRALRLKQNHWFQSLPQVVVPMSLPPTTTLYTHLFLPENV